MMTEGYINQLDESRVVFVCCRCGLTLHADQRFEISIIGGTPRNGIGGWYCESCWYAADSEEPEA